MEKKSEDSNFFPRQSFLELAEVSILIDSYDDIFSDFDQALILKEHCLMILLFR